ncbi:helix-turn-helix domain-containing protein [Cloacibacterium sp.]|uniref:helix-turn-helix domain-containing protein n=1 Tax=Cloacibacterium sp. TaxID=1913682 RepID=UPI0035B4BD6A
MKIFTKFDYNTVCKKVLEDKLGNLDLKYRIIAFGEVEFLEKIPSEKMILLKKDLEEYGITIIENQKTVLIEKIKETIMEMVSSDEPLNVKASVYLSEKLSHSYGYLSNLFSEITFSSIENYIMLQKIERAKSLIIKDNLTLTEVAYKLNYSSVAHLSTQFKNITGITPSQFQRIISKRREIANKQ